MSAQFASKSPRLLEECENVWQIGVVVDRCGKKHSAAFSLRPSCTYGHELWAVTNRMRLDTNGRNRLSLQEDSTQPLNIWECNQLRWFRQLIRMCKHWGFPGLNSEHIGEVIYPVWPRSDSGGAGKHCWGNTLLRLLTRGGWCKLTLLNLWKCNKAWLGPKVITLPFV